MDSNASFIFPFKTNEKSLANSPAFDSYNALSGVFILVGNNLGYLLEACAEEAQKYYDI